jgi:hypothetical protein
MNRSFTYCFIFWLCSATQLQAGSDWFALTDFNGYWTNNGELSLAQALKNHVKDNKEFKCIAFTPDGDWVILFGTNDVWTSNGELPAVKKLLELNKAGKQIHCVAFTPNNGWVILCDRMNPVSSGIPDDVVKKMEEYTKGGHTLRSIAFLPNGAWVLLINENGLFYSSSTPDDLGKVLDRLFNKGKGIPIRCVASTTFGDWFVLTEKEYWTSAPDHPAAKYLAKLKKDGHPMKWVAVAPEDPATAQFRLEVRPKQSIKAVLKIDAVADGKVEDYVIYTPVVPTLPGQPDVRATFSPEGKVVHEDGPQQRPLILNRIIDGRQEVHTALTIKATLMSRQLRQMHPEEKASSVPDLSPEEVKLFTLSSETGQPNSGPFREWMGRVGLKRKDGENDLTIAFRTLQYIRHHFRYEFPPPPGDRSLSTVCGTGKSDCGGLSNLFIWLMRDNGVPARKLCGRLASSGKPYDGNSTKSDSEGKEHCKAEFFARGVGWVPIDIAHAVSTPNASDFSVFGNDPGDFVALSHDPFGMIETFQNGKQEGVANQGVFLWWRNPSDKTRKVRVEVTWTVTKEPMANPSPK